LAATACTATRADLDGLGVGDAFLPGGDWWWTQEHGGRLAIVDSSQRSGAFFEPIDERSAKLCLSDDDLSGGGSLMAENEDKTVPGGSLEPVLDAPLVVHVEVATVTLTGRAWSELRPGDVIRTDQRLGEQATLCIAGRAAARGELVNVEGELGVRIRRLVDEESDG
jgi:flagellar motor switch/type III secretory pathway protein FliN